MGPPALVVFALAAFEKSSDMDICWAFDTAIPPVHNV